MSRFGSKQRWGFAAGSLFLILLLAAVFTFGSLGVPFEPKNWRDVLTLYAVSSFITAAFMIFGLILFRTVVRLWIERSKDHLGARFKTKMVVGAMAISLLPVLFMFFVSYSLLNRTLGRWFPAPARNCLRTNSITAQRFRPHPDPASPHSRAPHWPLSAKPLPKFLGHAVAAGADAVWILVRTETPLAAASSATTRLKARHFHLRRTQRPRQTDARPSQRH